MFLLGILLLVVLVWVAYFMMPAPAGLPILAYHKLSSSAPGEVVVTASQLNEQLAAIERLGFTPIWFADLKQILTGYQPLPNKPVVLTFDDECENVYSLAYPLLRKYQIKANLFLPTKLPRSAEAEARVFKEEIIGEMMKGLVRVGVLLNRLESDEPYSAAQIDEDLRQSTGAMKQVQCSFAHVIAYPYGVARSSRRFRKAIKPIFEQHGVDFTVDIGSGTNYFPLRDVFQLRRTTINGTDSLSRFKKKLKGGRVLGWNGNARSRSAAKSQRARRAAELIH